MCGGSLARDIDNEQYGKLVTTLLASVHTAGSYVVLGTVHNLAVHPEVRLPPT